MVRSTTRIVALALCLVGVLCLEVAPKDSAEDPKAIEGLWSGTWGGGMREGAVIQPAIAVLFIKGDHVELSGFRNGTSLTGTVRFDASAKRVQITPAAAPGKPAPKPVVYAYELKADKLTLTDSDKFAISLQKHPLAEKPLANAAIELIAADGINDAGDLLVTEFTELRVGRDAATYFKPEHRSLKTKQATVLQVQETGLKKLTLAQARGLVRKSTPVAVTYRHDDRPPPEQHELWKEIGSPSSDSEAAGQTLSRLLRPGTLVFVLSARENVPVP